MFSDTIADMLTRIRNGYMAKKKSVIIPFSNIKMAIAKIMIKNNYLKDAKLLKKDNKKDIQITLLYQDNKPSIKKIERISKSGRRIYKSKDNLPYVLSGHGHAIISTSQGIMMANEARKKSLGGEVICQIW